MAFLLPKAIFESRRLARGDHVRVSTHFGGLTSKILVITCASWICAFQNMLAPAISGMAPQSIRFMNGFVHMLHYALQAQTQ